MNATLTSVSLEKVFANPWQPRKSVDLPAIMELALSIVRDGLMQPPVARRAPDGDGYQLAIGHRRLEAYRHLSDAQRQVQKHRETKQYYDGNAQNKELITPVIRAMDRQGRTFEEIPLNILDLTDQQMFEMAVAENLQRQDLNPVEIAEAEQRYMTEFGKNSREAAEFFGKSDATIRGDVRLLELPQPAKEKLAGGEITIGAARKLLTIQRAVGSEAASKAVKAMAEPGAEAEEIINRTLRLSEGSVEMWGSWRDQDKPLAGYGLWPLALPKSGFPDDLLPELTKGAALKALGIESENIPDSFSDVFTCLKYDPSGYQKYIGTGWIDDNLIERLVHLIDPPGCSTCPYYARVEHAHYCAFAACRKRKIQAWGQAELALYSKTLGIPAYAADVHGKDVVALKVEYGDKGKAKKLFDARTDICLRAKYSSNQAMYANKHDFTDSYLVEAVVVGETARKLIEKRKQANGRSEQEQQWAEESRRRNIDWENRRHSGAFIKEVAGLVFAPAFVGMDKVEPLVALLHRGDIVIAGFEKASRGKKLELLRQEMAERALDNVIGYAIQERGPLAVAGHLQGVATTWGVTLPADWLKLAEPYLAGLEEYEGLDGQKVVVSAETAAA